MPRHWNLKKWLFDALSSFGDGLFHSYTGSPINAQIRELRKRDNRPAPTISRTPSAKSQGRRGSSRHGG